MGYIADFTTHRLYSASNPLTSEGKKWCPVAFEMQLPDLFWFILERRITAGISFHRGLPFVQVTGWSNSGTVEIAIFADPSTTWRECTR